MKVNTSVILLALGLVEAAQAFRLSAGRAGLTLPLTPTNLKSLELPKSGQFIYGSVARNGDSKVNRSNKARLDATSTKAVETSNKGLGHSLKIGAIFGLWYVLNIGYNIYNKKVLNMVPKLTYTVAWLQLVIGLLYLFPVWLLGI
eukprot:gene44677-54636_t